jgi:hypothetical protein
MKRLLLAACWLSMLGFFACGAGIAIVGHTDHLGGAALTSLCAWVVTGLVYLNLPDDI